MDVVIRADASAQLGSGHVMRCLTLAHMLKDAGAAVSFVSRALPPGLEYLVSRDFQLFPLRRATDIDQGAEEVRETIEYFHRLGRPDWIVIDNYAIGAEWERSVRPHVSRIMVVDDLANRMHDCDLLLDQNLCPNFDTRYDALVPPDCLKLLGPRYALLRPEFYEARKHLRVRDGHIKRVLISFGGADPSNETAKALQAMLLLELHRVEVDVVLGGSHPQAEVVARLCSQLPQASLHHDVRNMAELMREADVAIGAPGTTTWERCILGLPAVTVEVADNQQALAEGVSSAGAIVNLGWHEEVTSEKIAEAVAALGQDPQKVLRMGEAGFRIMQDNSEAARRQIVNAIVNWKEGHEQSI